LPIFTDAQTKSARIFLKCWHPCHSFFTDEQGRLYIMTYKDGENPGEKIFDIFNPDGVLMPGRACIFTGTQVERFMEKSRRITFIASERRRTDLKSWWFIR